MVALSGGPGPLELKASSVVRTGSSLSQVLAPGVAYFSVPGSGGDFTLPPIASVPPGAQILIHNNSDESLDITSNAVDTINDAGLGAQVAMGGGSRLLFVALGVDVATGASWFTFDP